MTTTQAQPFTPPVSRWRRTGMTVLAALLAVLTGGIMGGFPAFVGAFVADGADVIHRIHALHWGALMGVLVAVPFAALALRPRIAAGQQVGLVAVTFVVAALASAVTDPLIVVVPLATAVVLALHPARRDLFRRAREAVDRTSVLLAAVATPPLLWYAWGEVQTHLGASLSDPHRGPPEHHYVSGAALALAIVAVAWLCAFRTDGWRVPAWCVAVVMVMLGLGSLILPGYVGSFGTWWGAGALAWGIGFVTATLADRHREAAARV